MIDSPIPFGCVGAPLGHVARARGVACVPLASLETSGVGAHAQFDRYVGSVPGQSRTLGIPGVAVA